MKRIDPNIGINPNEHYEKARELYNKYPKLHEKVLTSLMDWRGNWIYIVSNGEYSNELWNRHKALGRKGNLVESMGAIIKENPRILK